MKFYNYIWIDRGPSSIDEYWIASDEGSVPKGKIAARVVLTDGEKTALAATFDWKEYQELLEHLFDRGQKVVTSNN